MNRSTFLSVLVLVIVVGIATAVLATRPAPAPSVETVGEASSTPAAAPKLAVDLYPLYDGISWEPATSTVSNLPGANVDGVSVTSVPVTNIMDPSSIIMPFTQYYDKLLKSHGWTEDMNLDAGGHTGGETAYRNGVGLILVSYHIVYHVSPPDAPSECPCDVTTTLFSSPPNLD